MAMQAGQMAVVMIRGVSVVTVTAPPSPGSEEQTRQDGRNTLKYIQEHTRSVQPGRD